jgi:two-component system OmpR family sensor kinase/two-component system sensor histidine kinase RstB
MKIGRSFFSLYFLVISTFVISSWFLDHAWDSYLVQDIESYTGYKTMLAAVGDYMQKQPKDEWHKIVEGAATRYNLPLSLILSHEVSATKNILENSLSDKNMQIYYDKDQVILHYLIENDGYVLMLGPANMPTRPKLKSYVRVIMLIVLGLAIFVWVWPMSRDLEQLKKSTRLFGQGDFTVKAPNAKSSMMMPMINAFNMMSARIKKLITAQKELTNAVAHELRTPLARSKFALQMVNQIDDEAKKEKYLAQINDDIHELEELINEMLIYSSFESDKPVLHFEPININDIVDAQVIKHAQFTGSITVTKSSEIIMANCDGHFIDRALNNYISNAIKYGAGQVRISVEQCSEHCIIRVEDNGKGVSENFKSTIFDAFSRGDESRNRETGGFGLGLAIVSRIMQWHHGDASIEDSTLGGAAFLLKWPLNKNQH